jgi:predicted DNA-binding protein
MAEGYTRITIKLSDYEMRRLICWAKIHGKPKATYAAQIIGSQIESNFDTINAQMANIAKFENISIGELEQHWLQEEKFISLPPDVTPNLGKEDKKQKPR